MIDDNDRPELPSNPPPERDDKPEPPPRRIIRENEVPKRYLDKDLL